MLTTYPLLNDNGSMYAVLGISIDITKQKKLEDQLQQAQKMEAIGTLSGGIAHDFNNLLTTILGNSDFIMADLKREDPLYEDMEEIKRAAERGSNLTRQLLAFSRKQITQPSILDFNELLTDIEKMLRRLIGEDVEMQIIPSSELWLIKVDLGQMEQVIMNLVVNAKDAMPKGGKLTIETSNEDLGKNFFHEHGFAGQPGAYVRLSVTDNGIGMDKEIEERIFEPFYTTKETGKGTGLGLSTVYGIIKQNNGYILVDTTPEEGCTFDIYLPKTKEDMVSEKKEQPPVTKLIGSETVLFVEDDNSVRKLGRSVLKKKGYKVLVAEDGKDALRVSNAHDGSIDLLITDVVMPKIGGKELSERLQPLFPDIKVIFMSGYTDDAIVHHGILDSEVNFLEKPFTPEGLAKKTREILDNK
ncbi:ATP-binding protein [Thermodesulfobacteriota bacterium]